MENLEQRRARNALAKAPHCGKGDGGDCLSGYPGLIINNGLLACLAFSLEKEGQHQKVAHAIAYHLDEMKVCQRLGDAEADATWLLRHLASSQATDHTLRRATDESLAFLGYLKRFVKTPLAIPQS